MGDVYWRSAALGRNDWPSGMFRLVCLLTLHQNLCTAQYFTEHFFLHVTLQNLLGNWISLSAFRTTVILLVLSVTSLCTKYIHSPIVQHVYLAN